MLFLILNNISSEITKFDLFGLIFGHLIFAIAASKLFDWSWLKNLMKEDEKQKMLSSYTWKDLLVDAGIISVLIGSIFFIISLFL